MSSPAFDEVEIFIEIAKGSREKGLYDERTHERRGTRVINRPCPHAYGFVLGTVGDGEEAVDSFFLSGEPVGAAAVVVGEPVALMEFWEGESEGAGWEVDHKVISVPPGTVFHPRPGLLDELRDFYYGVFEDYPEVTVKVGRLRGKKAAVAFLRDARRKDENP